MKACAVAVASILVFGLFTSTAWSSEADELRDKAKAVQRESAELAKQGKHEEADQLRREYKELLQAAQKHDMKESKAHVRTGEMHELEQRLKGLAEKERALKQAGNKEALTEVQKHRTAIEHELKTLRAHLKHQPETPSAAKSPHGAPAEREEAARRIKQAGERELRQAHEHLAKQRSGHEPLNSPEHHATPLDELRRDIQQLRAELKELREEFKKRP
jgi:hypothetical protein